MLYPAILIQKQYRDLIEIAVQSSVDEMIVFGKFTEQKDQPSRRLQEESGETNLAFTMHVVEHSERSIKIQLEFEDIRSVSKF